MNGTLVDGALQHMYTNTLVLVMYTMYIYVCNAAFLSYRIDCFCVSSAANAFYFRLNAFGAVLVILENERFLFALICCHISTIERESTSSMRTSDCDCDRNCDCACDRDCDCDCGFGCRFGDGDDGDC